MKKSKSQLLILLPIGAIFSFLFLNFSSPNPVTSETYSVDKDFGSFWYQGKAEVSVYDLSQVRYGEERKGTASLIFVTEDFNTKKQVKSDAPTSKETTPVLKLNQVKKFNTGIYPYSLMTSTFSPMGKIAIKSTSSIQEWCGHTYLQLNKKEGKDYQVTGFSYFENEGDINQITSVDYLEDDLWNRIRISPASLPQGTCTILPAGFYLRLKHKEIKGYQASTKLTNKGDQQVYSITYPALSRELSITFSSIAPYAIQSWTESYPEAGKTMTTTATLKKREWMAYWSKNSSQFDGLRTEFGL
ncbi:MAG: hypothetical protein AB8B61_07510 [Cyclobacteriaceae bacterium]